jgi:hypothetical protein
MEHCHLMRRVIRSEFASPRLHSSKTRKTTPVFDSMSYRHVSTKLGEDADGSVLSPEANPRARRCQHDTLRILEAF